MDVATFTSHRRSVTTEGGEIGYAEFGEGPVSLFVHGFGLNGLLWRNVIEQLRGTSRCIAVDLPAHGGTPARDDMSATAMAEIVADLCAALGIEQVDLVGNDTGGAVAQVVAGRHPELLRSLTLTNCDTEGNFPPPEFGPLARLAAQGALTDLIVGTASDPAKWRTGPLAEGYEDADTVPEEVLADYFTHMQAERARDLQRMLAAMDNSELTAVNAALGEFEVPTLLVWATAYSPFDIKWAQRLAELIPGVREIVEVPGARLFFPDERPEDLVPHLRRHWNR